MIKLTNYPIWNIKTGDITRFKNEGGVGEVTHPQNRPCTPKIVGTFYMQGYKVNEKTAIVPHCTSSFKTQWAP
jgi:hypothetical protein